MNHEQMQTLATLTRHNQHLDREVRDLAESVTNLAIIAQRAGRDVTDLAAHNLPGRFADHGHSLNRVWIRINELMNRMDYLEDRLIALTPDEDDYQDEDDDWIPDTQDDVTQGYRFFSPMDLIEMFPDEEDEPELCDCPPGTCAVEDTVAEILNLDNVSTGIADGIDFSEPDQGKFIDSIIEQVMADPQASQAVRNIEAFGLPVNLRKAITALIGTGGS